MKMETAKTEEKKNFREGKRMAGPRPAGLGAPSRQKDRAGSWSGSWAGFGEWRAGLAGQRQPRFPVSQAAQAQAMHGRASALTARGPEKTRASS